MKLREMLYHIIFEADTRAGKLFDVLLIVSILSSVIVIMLDSVPEIHAQYGEALYIAEWFFTLLFSFEYLLRLYSTNHPRAYARSFYGVVDLIAVLPTYISLLVPGTQFLLVIRVLRVLRIFRVLKLVQYMGEANQILRSLYLNRRKIFLFFFAVVTLVVILGSFMHLLEGHINPGFKSIPMSIYWAVVTLTTVGYGDISPVTFLGRALAAAIMILGYSIIAVPAAMVTAEIIKKPRVCPHCQYKEREENAPFCKMCGSQLNGENK